MNSCNAFTYELQPLSQIHLLVQYAKCHTPYHMQLCGLVAQGTWCQHEAHANDVDTRLVAKDRRNEVGKSHSSKYQRDEGNESDSKNTNIAIAADTPLTDVIWPLVNETGRIAEWRSQGRKSERNNFAPFFIPKIMTLTPFTLVHAYTIDLRTCYCDPDPDLEQWFSIVINYLWCKSRADESLVKSQWVCFLCKLCNSLPYSYVQPD